MILSFYTGGGELLSPLHGLIFIHTPHQHLPQPHTLARAPTRRFHVAVPNSPPGGVVPPTPSVHAPVLLALCYPLDCATSRSSRRCLVTMALVWPVFLDRQEIEERKIRDWWRSNSSPTGGAGASHPQAKHKVSSTCDYAWRYGEKKPTKRQFHEKGAGVWWSQSQS